MTQSIYIGNLPQGVSEEEVRELFQQYGTVHGVHLIVDQDTGELQGHGFVEMDDEAALEAITMLSETQFKGKTLQVNKAREKRR